MSFCQFVGLPAARDHALFMREWLPTLIKSGCEGMIVHLDTQRTCPWSTIT
jgi:hypothetical protein